MSNQITYKEKLSKQYIELCNMLNAACQELIFKNRFLVTWIDEAESEKLYNEAREASNLLEQSLECLEIADRIVPIYKRPDKEPEFRT